MKVACSLAIIIVFATLFRSENPVFCAVDVRMGRHFMQLSGLYNCQVYQSTRP